MVFQPDDAGRFRWRPRGATIPRKVGLFALIIAEGHAADDGGGHQTQASLYVVQGREALGNTTWWARGLEAECRHSAARSRERTIP